MKQNNGKNMKDRIPFDDVFDPLTGSFSHGDEPSALLKAAREADRIIQNIQSNLDVLTARKGRGN